MSENELASIVVSCGLKIHRSIGPGLLESAYEACLFYELSELGLKVEKQKPLYLKYGNIQLDCAYRIDLMIEDKLLVELKAVEKLDPIHIAQTLTYLRISNCKLGLLINFNTSMFMHGVKRVINSSR